MRVHSLTLSYTLGSIRCDSWASFSARTLASPCLGRESKVRVATSFSNSHVDDESSDLEKSVGEE